MAYCRLLVLLVLFSLAGNNSYAQWIGRVKYELGIAAGTFIYQGDLSPSDMGSYRTPGPVFAVYGSRIFNRSLAFRINLSAGGLRGDESKYDYPAYRQQRNFAFRSAVVELAGQLVWSPTAGNYKNKGFVPYVFGGAGLSFRSLSRDWSNFNHSWFADNADVQSGLTIDMARSLSRFIPVIPVGAGLRYNISPKISINAETGYRITFTDYVDGFSYAANPDKRDYYLSHTIGIVYRFGRRNSFNCPVIRP